LNSGFTACSTTSDVLADLDLTGRNVVVTAGHRGLGLVTTRALAAAGASVTVASSHCDTDPLDLLEPASIEDFARRWGTKPLHVLVNCAAYPASPTLELDARGFEKQFATDHLGHFALTRKLLPALRAAGNSRVVTLTSGAQRFGEIRWDDPNFREGYHPQVAYAQSKRANVLFTVELDRRYATDGVRAYAVHPGVVVMGAADNPAWAETLRDQGLLDTDGNPVIDPARGKKNPEQGAATIVFAAAHPLLDDVGGVYLKDCDVSSVDAELRLLTADEIPSDADPDSLDPVAARRLWDLSEELLGLR